MMDVAASSRGQVLLSENSDVDRPDAGTVIGVGPRPKSGRYPNGGEYDIKPGDHVLVTRFSGIWFRNLTLDGLVLWEVRFYGIVDVDEYTQEGEDIMDNIVAVAEESGLRPTEDKILLRRDPSNSKTEGGVMLTASGEYRTQKATVVAVGSTVTEVKPGDRVIYHGPSQHVGLQGIHGIYPELEGDPSDYSLIRESGIYCVID